LKDTSSTASLATRALQAWLFLLRHETKYTRIQLRTLIRRNRRSDAPVVAPGGPVVSLTTYGERLRSVHLAIESIAAGSLLPSRLILWIDNPADMERQPAGLRRLVDRGLEVRLSENYGPHTKYFPYLLSEDRFHVPLVTADDDLLYSRWWLEGLVQANFEYPGAVNCYRAHRIHTSNGAVAPYRSWKPCHSSRPDFSHFATGVSGCIYPPAFLAHLKRAGDAFLGLCPKADDVWLHVNALRSGFRVRQIWSRPLRFPFVPGTQNSGLYHDNVLLSRNDEHIRNTYTTADIEMLEASSQHSVLQVP
jgi:hypothetical protein